MRQSTEGFLLLDSSLKLIYASPGAIEILAYPEKSRDISSLDTFLTERIKMDLLKEQSSLRSGFVPEITSGKRRYLCRAYSLNSHSHEEENKPALALLIERSRRLTVDTFQLAEQFHLTRRERETTEYLIQGLTSKEIAMRMNISPNTVKAFLRLIMVKTGTTTRSGIISRIFRRQAAIPPF